MNSSENRSSEKLPVIMDNLKRLQFLKNSAFQLKETCPAVASFLLWTHSCIPDGKIKSSGVCKHCFQILHPENHRVHLKPKKKITTQTRKLLQHKAANWKLTLKQLRKLWKYEKSQNKLLVTCYTCKETSRFNGAKRRSLAVRPHIPRSLTKNKSDIKTLEGRRMPQSTEKATKYSPLVNKLSSEIKSPATTPRTSVSTPSTSSPSLKSVKGKKLQCSRLKMLLNSEQKQQSTKASLKDFLSSV
ncbi:UPF0711 protein C18orf21 homolog isoform X2 [Hypanus sabinus]|uniref:UPF0711 protein C18orf21 homolog isoform X2 n=1 Tax=Hypanus sabinus TaxID=79690 RepID=UPI0028C49EF8|nr:UPF0711 protein C18orf21 homolog isoform X2 [Hypanus sabinus]XP_059801542.1 UPF0711 protein C18orf21 homolog isoform X2 [Hypanus sabinus]